MKRRHDYDDGHKKTNGKILLTSLSAMGAETTTFPMDLTKTRLQLHGESLSSTRPTNAFRVASKIVREQEPLGIYKVLGGVSGIIGQVVANPADLVKIRMQSDGRMASQGLEPGYSGPLDAFNKIIHAEGFRGLWQGVFSNLQGALVNMGELACYDHAKRFVIQNKILRIMFSPTH
ncbi:mitochondrial uncoupling protein 3 [Quillaja saponaria]|uniref:Mitochondrial uncoupling protein 3 n=1 Tax=Quillaja saponaria TaxID=32244 RepID=A0AAD7LAP5_QUISA|nr:mitochondrial uncoupling protein 3 [Quillaja saponaria]